MEKEIREPFRLEKETNTKVMNGKSMTETPRAEQIEKELEEILQLLAVSLPPLQERVERFRAIAAEASKTATSINQEIETIERSGVRVREVLAALPKAREHHEALTRCAEALERKDYDTAVRVVGQLQAFGDACSPLTKQRRAELHERTRQELLARFEAAAGQNDIRRLLATTTQLVQLGAAAEAIRRYAGYFDELLRKESDSLLGQITSADIAVVAARPVFSDAAKALVQYALKVVAQQTRAKAGEALTPAVFATFLQALEGSLVQRLAPLLNCFEQTRRLAYVQTLAAGSKAYPEQDVLLLLDELAMINNCIQYAFDYLAETAGAAQPARPAAAADLTRRLEGYMNAFVRLDQTVITQTIARNAKDCTRPAEFTEAVDTIFFLLLQSARRAVLSRSFMTVCAVINQHAETIRTTLVDFTRQMLRENRSFSAALAPVWP